MVRAVREHKKKLTGAHLKSWVWKYFTREEENEDLVSCKQCSWTYLNKSKDGCTNPMSYHLKKHHSTTKDDDQGNSITASTSSASSRAFFTPGAALWNKQGLPELMAIAVVEDRISMNTIKCSRFFKIALNSMGMPAYTSHNSIKKSAFSFLDKCQDSLKKEIKEYIDSGHKYSIIVDEWTSVNTKRYMSLCLATEATTVSLGMVRCRGSLTAVRTVELIKERLQKYGLTTENLAGFCSDGASVMKLAGRMLKIPHQLCLGNFDSYALFMQRDFGFYLTQLEYHIF